MAQLTVANLVSIRYRCQFSPNDIPELEKHKQTALMAAADASALGRVLEALSTDRYLQEIPELPDDIRKARAIELDNGLAALGKMIACISDQAVGAMNDFFDLLEEQEEKGGQDND